MDTTFRVLEYGQGGYGELAYHDPLGQNIERTAVNRVLTELPPPTFTGMKLKEDILLGDLVLNTIDENNVVWVCTDIEGWWVHPDPEIPDVTRGWADGSYDASGRWTARQITLSGVFMPPDPDLVPVTRDKLIQATTLVRSGAWLKTRENPTRAAFVRLSGRPQIETVTARGKTEFSIGLRAADPIKYSWNELDADGYDIVTIPCANALTLETGEMTIENVGNTDVTMFLEITGPITAPAIIYNLTNDELLTIVEPLRDAETRTVTDKSITNSVGTLTFSTLHDMVIGDTVTVTGVDATFDGTYAIIDTPTTSSISYAVDVASLSSTPSSGTVTRDIDVLEVDTYSKEVALNGETLGARVRVDTLTDWLTLAPGNNDIIFSDDGNANSPASLVIYYRSGWIA